MTNSLRQAIRPVFPFLQFAIYIGLLPFALIASPRFFPLFLLIPILWAMNWWVNRQLWPSTPINMALYVLSSALIISGFATPSLTLSMAKMIGLGYGIALFWACSLLCLRSLYQFAIGFISYWLIGLGIMGGVLSKTRWSPKIEAFSDLVATMNALQVYTEAIPLPSINANQVAGVMTLLTPLAIVTFLGTIIFRERILAICKSHMNYALVVLFLGIQTALYVFILLLTQSRTGWLAVIFAILLMVYLSGALGRRFVLFLIGAVLISNPWWLFDPVQRGSLLAMVGLQSGTVIVNNEIGGLNGRIEIWTSAISAIGDVPFTGLGMNIFREVVHRFYPLESIPAWVDVAHAHNHLLQTALDLGIPGLIAYFAIWITSVWVLFQIFNSVNDPLQRSLSIGFAGSLFAFWLYGITDTIALGAKPSFLWWMYLALIFSWHHHLVNGSPE